VLIDMGTSSGFFSPGDAFFHVSRSRTFGSRVHTFSRIGCISQIPPRSAFWGISSSGHSRVVNQPGGAGGDGVTLYFFAFVYHF
jgi:hypothetical protein